MLKQDWKSHFQNRTYISQGPMSSGARPTNDISIEFEIRSKLAGIVHFKLEHCKFWSNFELDRNSVSGTGTRPSSLWGFPTFLDSIWWWSRYWSVRLVLCTYVNIFQIFHITFIWPLLDTFLNITCTIVSYRLFTSYSLRQISTACTSTHMYSLYYINIFFFHFVV